MAISSPTIDVPVGAAAAAGSKLLAGAGDEAAILRVGRRRPGARRRRCRPLRARTTCVIESFQNSSSQADGHWRSPVRTRVTLALTARVDPVGGHTRERALAFDLRPITDLERGDERGAAERECDRDDDRRPCARRGRKIASSRSSASPHAYTRVERRCVQAAPEPFERDHRRCVGVCGEACHTVEREEQRRGGDEECDDRARRLGTWSAAREPHGERNEDRWSDREKLSLGHVLDEAGRERADLHDGDDGVRDGGCDENADAAIELPDRVASATRGFPGPRAGRRP